VTDSTLIAYNDNATPADGAALTANANDPTDGGRTIVNQDYEELNNFTNTEASIASGRNGISLSGIMELSQTLTTVCAW